MTSIGSDGRVEQNPSDQRRMTTMATWLLAGEAAKRLGLRAPTVRWLTDTGKLSCTRTVSGVRLISSKAVERLRVQRQGRQAAGPQRPDELR